MTIVYVRQIFRDDGKRDFEIGKGVSLYTPYTTHYELDTAKWNLSLEVNAVKSLLISSKVRGRIPVHAKLHYPPIKRKL